MLVDTSIPQPQPLPTSIGGSPGTMALQGIRSSSDIVDHLDKVLKAQPPEVQAAVDHAHDIMGLNPPSQAIADTPQSGATQSSPVTDPSVAQLPLAAPRADSVSLPASSQPSSPSIAQPLPSRAESPVQSSLQAAGVPEHPTTAALPSNPLVEKMSDQVAAGPGWHGIHNPFLKGLAAVGDTIGSGLFPEFAQFVPGTTAHHNELLGEEENQLGQEQKATKATDESRLQNAQAAERESLPELHNTQAELATSKLTQAKDIADAKQGTADAKQALADAEAERKRGESQQKIATGLAEHGLKMDPETKQLIPLPYTEMSEPQKAAHDLKAAQAELTTARSDYVTAQKDGIPAAQELARKRVDAAQESAATAAGRLGLSRDEFNAQFLGTAPGGEALAGGETDENGKPIGTKVAAGNKPGATVQGRASQAGSIIEVGNNLKAEIDKHKDALGNLSDYWKQATNGTPIADPVASKLMSEIASYAALQPAMHGMRGGQAMKEFEKMVGGIPKDPEALKAAIDGIGETAAVIKKQGQPAHAGVGSSAPPKPTTQAEYDAIKPGTVYVDTDGQQKKKK
jgi:hypothetical protein